jgi:hypothetical protein
VDHRPQQHKREGQAMAEFLVGLVCIMLLIAGIQQVSILSQRGFKSMNEARYAMALQYAENPPTEWPIFNFSEPAQAGRDQASYTADDTRPGGNDRFYQEIDGYLNKVDDGNLSDYLTQYRGYSVHSDLKFSEGTFAGTTALNMMYTSDQEVVDVVPFMDKVLGRDRILIGRDLWMPRWNAIP